MKEIPLTTDEIWKDIIGYEGIYKISSFGRILTLEKTYPHRHGLQKKRSIIRKVTTIKNRYPFLTLTKEGKMVVRKLHRLIAIHFIPNPENKRFINHKNGDKKDFRIENLEWCTQRENSIHAHRNGLCNPAKGVNNGKSKLNNEKALEIKRLYKTGLSQRKIASIIGEISRGAIRNIVEGKTWKDV